MINSDVVAITGIRARGLHGVLDFERRDGQDFVVDVSIEADLEPAGASDDLADTVNYAEIAADVVAIIEGPPVNLIETLADQIATAVLRRPAVRSVDVVVHKPEAPVGVPFTDVSVTVRRLRRTKVVIALGSNLGDSVATLQWAVLTLHGLLDLVAVSPVYQTTAVGGPAQDDYLNAVVIGWTDLPPRGLLSELHAIESEAGRTREVRWGPRTLDLDLIQYGDPAFDTDVSSDRPFLVLPHPRAHERGFVLAPWADADPDATLRVNGQVTRVADLLATLGTDGVRPRHDVSLEEEPPW